MKYDLKFYPNGSDKPTASVCVETDNTVKFGKFSERADVVLAELGYCAETARSNGDLLYSPIHAMFHKSDPYTAYDTSAPGRVVCEYNGVRKEKELFFNEEDAIAAMLYSCFLTVAANNNDITISSSGNAAPKCISSYKSLKDLALTIEYKGDIYTDIPKISPIGSNLGFCGMRFFSKKNNEDEAEYYLLAKTVFNDPEDSRGITQSPSTGIIKAHSDIAVECLYSGSFIRVKKYTDPNVPIVNEGSVGWVDEDGNTVTQTEKVDEVPVGYDNKLLSAAHLFFERFGKDFSFSVLINGKLYKKISKTEDSVVFYRTPLKYPKDPAAKSEYTECNEQIVFRNVNGTYINSENIFSTGWYSMDKAVNSSITLPPVPDTESTPSVLSEFYLNCIRALYKAFETSEKYFTTKYQWLTDDYEMNIEWSEKTKNGFATSTPPACQVDIEKIGSGKYVFSYEEVKITANASVCCGDIDFEEYFQVPFPDFEVESVGFTVNGDSIVLKPSFASLNIEITDAETKDIFKGEFGSLKAHMNYKIPGIPKNLYFKKDWRSVKKNFNRYQIIKDLIVNLGIKNCRDLLENNFGQRDRISALLYGDAGMIPDENIITAAAQLENEFIRTKKVPNAAIVGQAGTGKTTLARNLGKIFGKEILACTPSDLRGAYIGHTKHQVVLKLAEAALENQILYVDEVYQLMEDPHGHEAVTVLLPLMTGDQTRVESGLDKGQKDTVELDFGDVESGRKGYYKVTDSDGKQKEYKELEPGVVPIWISGYDDEVRRMISQNQGLYRRLKKLVIKTPLTSELIKQFNGELDKLAGGNDAAARKAVILKKHFDENGMDPVRKFFGWGAQPQNSKYFASHAGVSNFLANCIDSIDFGKDIGVQIEDIIISTKLDIKRQLSAIRSGSNQTAFADTVNVITDIDTRFKDLIGCESQIAYMQSIIDMLVNKGIYEKNDLTVPKGALMEGLPGTGKTFIARAMAGELQERFQKEAADKRFGFMAFSAAELGNKPSNYIASVFSTAEEYDACIIFIDEVDAIAKHRSINSFYDRYLELIAQMDGIEQRSNVFILAATNAPEQLDPAFVRSGRIDKNLVFTLPDKGSRAVIAKEAIEKRLKTLVNFEPQEKDKDIDEIVKLTVRKTTGYTAGDIKNIINTAFIAYHQYTHSDEPNSTIDKDLFNGYQFIDEKSHSVNPKKLNRDIKDENLRALWAFIEEEIERKALGAANYSKKEEEFSTEKNGNNCSSTAIHEVGHAVVSLMLGEEPFDTITVIPRGEALGYVSHSELKMVTKADYENHIRICMGGRIAEEIIFGKGNISGGASQDIRQATHYAHIMVEQVGFTDDFGFMALSERRGKYLGGERNYTCSDAFREKSDAAVSELLKKLYNETLGMLANRKELIERLARRVFETESMDGSAFKRLYEEELKRLGNK